MVSIFLDVFGLSFSEPCPLKKPYQYVRGRATCKGRLYYKTYGQSAAGKNIRPFSNGAL